MSSILFSHALWENLQSSASKPRINTCLNLKFESIWDNFQISRGCRRFWRSIGSFLLTHLFRIFSGRWRGSAFVCSRSLKHFRLRHEGGFLITLWFFSRSARSAAISPPVGAACSAESAWLAAPLVVKNIEAKRLRRLFHHENWMKFRMCNARANRSRSSFEYYTILFGLNSLPPVSEARKLLANSRKCLKIRMLPRKPFASLIPRIFLKVSPQFPKCASLSPILSQRIISISEV